MPWINHLPPVCWSTFGILVWNDSGYVNLTQWWYFFIIFEYILHISTPHIMIFCFPLPYFPLSTSALFLLSTLVLTLYIDVVLSLSIRLDCSGWNITYLTKYRPCLLPWVALHYVYRYLPSVIDGDFTWFSTNQWNPENKQCPTDIIQNLFVIWEGVSIIIPLICSQWT